MTKQLLRTRKKYPITYKVCVNSHIQAITDTLYVIARNIPELSKYEVRRCRQQYADQRILNGCCDNVSCLAS